MKFEFYVLNYDFNKKKVVNYNIFNNIRVQEWTEKAVRKYLRSPKKFKYEPFSKDAETLYGFEALCKEIESIIRCEEWSRCEYEIAVGSLFITEIRDVVREVERGNLAVENLYDELKKQEQCNFKLEKWDCFGQAKPNIPMIAREVIYQYKEQLKTKEETSENFKE